MENNDYIFKYFNSELSEQERNEFEQKCETDSDFAKEVALFLETKAQAQQALKAQFKQTYKKRKRNRRWLILVAVIWLLLAIGYLIYDSQSEAGTEELTPELIFASLTPPLDKVRSSDNDNTINVLDLYESENYDSLIAVASSYDLSTVDNVNWVMTKALSEFGKGRYFETIQTIKTFDEANANNAILEGERLWIQSLAYWKLNNLERAKANWQIIIDENYKRKDQAEQLLKQLE